MRDGPGTTDQVNILINKLLGRAVQPIQVIIRYHLLPGRYIGEIGQSGGDLSFFFSRITDFRSSPSNIARTLEEPTR